MAPTVSDARGRFTLPPRPGTYEVQVDVQGAALPRCNNVTAKVRKGRLTLATLRCDSGMR
jgi:hypothetical protein